MQQNEAFIEIAYTTPESEITREEKAVRREFDEAVNQAAQRYLAKSRLQDVLGIELYPCDEECEAA